MDLWKLTSHSRAQARERDREREACGWKMDVADAAGDGAGEGKRYRRERDGRGRSCVLVSRRDGRERETVGRLVFSCVKRREDTERLCVCVCVCVREKRQLEKKKWLSIGSPSIAIIKVLTV